MTAAAFIECYWAWKVFEATCGGMKIAGKDAE